MYPGEPVDQDARAIRPLRVCLVEFSPSGGLFQFAFQLGAGLAEFGHQVELVTGPHPELRSTNDGFVVRSLLPTWSPGDHLDSRLLQKARRVGRGVRYVDSWRRVLGHIRRQQPHVVQFAEWRFVVDGWMCAWLARRSWAPVLVDLAHSPQPLHEQRHDAPLYKSGPLLHRALAAGYRSLDAVLVLGAQSRDQLTRTWPGLRRVEVIPHGDEHIFTPDEPVTPAEGTERRLLFFGVWTRYKGLDHLLDAFRVVRRRVPDAQLVVAGAVGADVDFPALVRQADDVGGVELRPGYVPVEEVAGLVGGCRAVVAPYRAANQSGVVQLAHTLSRPVIVTDVGDLASTVEDGETGLVVPAGEVEALANALERLLLHPDEAGRMGRKGRQRSEAQASWADVAQQVSTIYEELLRRRRNDSGRLSSTRAGRPSAMPPVGGRWRSEKRRARSPRWSWRIGTGRRSGSRRSLPRMRQLRMPPPG